MPISPRAPEIGFPAFADSSREQLLVLILDERCEATQQPSAIGRGDGAPRREGGFRPCDGGVGLFDAGLLELRNRFLGGGIDDREGHAGIQHHEATCCDVAGVGRRLPHWRDAIGAVQADGACR